MQDIKILVKQAKAADVTIGALVVPVVESTKPSESLKGLDTASGQVISSIMKSGDFRGKAKSTTVVYPRGRVKAKRLILVGMGSAKEATFETVRDCYIKAGIAVQGCKCRSAVMLPPVDLTLDTLTATSAAISGLALKSYQFLEYKTGKDAKPSGLSSCTILLDKKDDPEPYKAIAKREVIISAGVSLAREVSDIPAMDMYPVKFAEVAKEMCKAEGLEYKELKPAEMKKLGMNAHLAVGQGSKQEPRVVIMTHNGGKKDDQPLCFVGKGLTFDSGGLCIKGAANMDKMKFDMCGAAAVIGAMKTIAGLNLPINVVGICAMAENMPDGGAYRPGDVLRSMSGKSIEVVNTDAEGRLVLADSLYYASLMNPAAIVDLATLTGACVVALGTEIAGLFSNSDGLSEQITAAGESAGEPFWRLPIRPSMKELLESDIADVCHSARIRWGGASNAAAFLSHFIQKCNWAHLDIASACFAPAELKGASGFGARTLVELADRFETL
jgi:leucyl aminopeptidase